MNYGDDFKGFKAPASTSESEPSDKAKKNKKKKQHKDKRDSGESRSSTTSATGVNMTEVGGKRRRNKKDEYKIMCFNCDKKAHYANKCWEPQKSKN